MRIWAVVSPAALGKSVSSWARTAHGEMGECSEHHPLTVNGGSANLTTVDWGTGMS